MSIRRQLLILLLVVPVFGFGQSSVVVMPNSPTAGPSAQATQATSLIVNDTAANTDFSMTNTTAATSGTPPQSPFGNIGSNCWLFPTPSSSTLGSIPDSWSYQTAGTATITAPVTNVAETAGIVTLTVTSGTFGAGTWVTLGGLTHATWLNGVTNPPIYLFSATATTLQFYDPANHADLGSTAETGTVAQGLNVLRFSHSGCPQALYQLNNVNLKLANTLPATNNSINWSPNLVWQQTYWTGAASATDVFAIQSENTATANGPSTLEIDHAGTSGATNIDIQDPTCLTWRAAPGANPSIVGDIGLCRAAANILEVSSSSTHATTGLLAAAAFMSEGTKFTTNAGCSEVTTVGGATAGKITTVGSTSCTTIVTMGNTATAPNGWACFAHDLTTSADYNNPHVSSTATTATIVTGTIVAADVIEFGCIGY